MFKRCVAAIAAALVFSVGHTAPLSAKDLEECKGLARIARSMMNLRQEGAPMSDLMELAMAEKDPYFQDIFQLFVELVFEYPLYTTPEAKSRAVSEVDAFAYKGCLKNLKESAATSK